LRGLPEELRAEERHPVLGAMPSSAPGCGRASVSAELVRYGRELEAARAAQDSEGFSGRPEVDRWLAEDPNAFLIGVLFTQGIPAERAWSGPWELRNRLGHLDVDRLARMSAEDVEKSLAASPALHRFRRTLPRYIVGAARHLEERWGGEASRIWAGEPSAEELTERLEAVPGIGHKKAAMAVEILIRTFGVAVREHEGARLPYDVQVRRVMLRTGLVDVDDRAEMQAAAVEASPDRPSLIDLPLWLIGRHWCRPRAPLCDECRLGSVCPKLTDRAVEGVGVRKRSGGASPAAR
jgi:uncharacterized HhH-GPD family protein